MAAEQTVSLKEGFNFISFTIAPSDSSASKLRQDNILIIEDIFFYSPSAGAFLSLSEGTLSALSAGKGYIVKSLADASIVVSGAAVAEISAVSLKAGFNLIGVSPEVEKITFSDLMKKYDIIKGIYKWNVSAGTFFSVVTDSAGTPCALEGIDPVLTRGGSYFINITEDTDFTISGAGVVAFGPHTLPVSQPSQSDAYTDIIIPEILTVSGGVQSSPAPSGSVYYFTGSKDESDIQLDDNIKRYQTVKRYMRISGSARPLNAGYTDRFYHGVLFSVTKSSGGVVTTVNSYSIPVDSQNRFDGYIYFTEPGDFKIYTYRAKNDTLYPRAPMFTAVNENSSTLVFEVSCTEAVPSDLIYLLPSRDVNCGNKFVRDYAAYLTAGLNSDIEKVKKIYEFLVFGDSAGAFTYDTYDTIFPGYLESSWNSVFMPSHFLIRRRGVCNDYAELFAAMCRSCGMPVKRKSGDDSNGYGHQWNLIYLDGSWKKLDVTWANNNPSNYKTFSEFYAEFDSFKFTQDHDYKYYNNVKEEY